jgi:hypothetical protein
VTDADGNGTWSREIAGIDYAIAAGARVINCSFGGPTGSEIVRDAIERARKKGVLLVAAAGNDGTNDDAHPVYPAAYPDSNILSVAAAAAMLLKQHSSWSVGDVSSRLRKKGDALKALNGKTASGRRLNIGNALG